LAASRSAIAFLVMLAAAAPASAAPLALSVARAYVLSEPATGQPALAITLSPESTAAFAGFTRENLDKVVEFRIDGKVVMAPTVREPILRGEVQVSGNFTRLDLLETANRIWSGKARVEVEAKAD
jgi:preprotein translocase subunit SecD